MYSSNSELIVILQIFGTFYLIFVWIPSAIFVSYIADQKGYNSFIWFLIELLFPLQFLPLIIISVLPNRKIQKYLKIISQNYNEQKYGPNPKDWNFKNTEDWS